MNQEPQIQNLLNKITLQIIIKIEIKNQNLIILIKFELTAPKTAKIFVPLRNNAVGSYDSTPSTCILLQF